MGVGVRANLLRLDSRVLRHTVGLRVGLVKGLGLGLGSGSGVRVRGRGRVRVRVRARVRVRVRVRVSELIPCP